GAGRKIEKARQRNGFASRVTQVARCGGEFQVAENKERVGVIRFLAEVSVFNLQRAIGEQLRAKIAEHAADNIVCGCARGLGAGAAANCRYGGSMNRSHEADRRCHRESDLSKKSVLTNHEQNSRNYSVKTI